jgi:hypothetical protein
MSSGIQDDDDLDPILRYAPPRARAQSQPLTESAALPVDRPWPPVLTNSAEFSGDRAIVEMRERLALQPEWVPEPPQNSAPRRGLWTIALQASGVFGVAALLAWVVVFIPSVTQIPRTTFSRISASTDSPTPVRPSDVMASSSVASSPVTAKAPPAPPNRAVAAAEPLVPQAKERTDARELPVPATSVGAVDIHPPVRGQISPAEQTLRAAAQEATTAAKRTALDFVTRQLDPDEIASMLRRADDFIKSGDLSSARLLLRRTAEAGNMQAALTLAGTFDPNVLAALSARDGAADIAMARLWYERAEQLGSSEAPRRLRQLASDALQ